MPEQFTGLLEIKGSQSVLFLNRGLDLTGDSRRLLTRKALAGVVARRADGADT